jgi:hypothetical protein
VSCGIQNVYNKFSLRRFLMMVPVDLRDEQGFSAVLYDSKPVQLSLLRNPLPFLQGVWQVSFQAG